MIAYRSALIHEITFFDESRAVSCLSKFDKGVKVGNEFYTDEGIDEQTEKQDRISYLSSYYPMDIKSS